jgi:exosome complex component RRP42
VKGASTAEKCSLKIPLIFGGDSDMASAQHLLLSPAELSYLHSSLSLTPPIRPDGRTANQFRPLIAETGVLPGANGSARICFADGTEAIVGVKAEVEKSKGASDEELRIVGDDAPPADDLDKGEIVEGENDGDAKGEMAWVDLTVEIPGLRDDDAGTTFLAAMLAEALLADGELAKRLYINRRFHWSLYIDVSYDELVQGHIH